MPPRLVVRWHTLVPLPYITVVGRISVMFYFASAQHLNLFQKAFGVTASEQIGSIIVLTILFVMLYRFALSYAVRWTLDFLDYRYLQNRDLAFLEGATGLEPK
jgi:hypothetical protein